MLYSLLEPRLRGRAAGLSHFRSIASEQLVASYNSTVNALDVGWIQSLSGECSANLARRHAERRHQASAQQFHSMVVEMVDRVMDKLHGYALEFNLAVGWNLHISATPPTFVNEAVQYNARREPVESQTMYRARLATRLWSLVVRAQKNQIEFFLLPTQSVMGLSKTEHYYPAVMTLLLNVQSCVWTLDEDVDFSVVGVERMCQRLFRMLVNKCISEMDSKSGRDPFATVCDASEELLAQFSDEQSQPSPGGGLEPEGPLFPNPELEAMPEYSFRSPGSNDGRASSAGSGDAKQTSSAAATCNGASVVVPAAATAGVSVSVNVSTETTVTHLTPVTAATINGAAASNLPTTAIPAVAVAPPVAAPLPAAPATPSPSPSTSSRMIRGMPPDAEATLSEPIETVSPRRANLISIGEFLRRMKNEIESADSGINLPSAKDVDRSAAADGYDIMHEIVRRASADAAASSPYKADQQEVESIMTRYDAYNDVLLSFTFLIERVERLITDVSEQGAQSFRRRDLGGVKRSCIDLVNAQANERRVLELRHDWLKMKDIGDTLNAHNTDTARRHATPPGAPLGLPSMSSGNDIQSANADSIVALDYLIDKVDAVVEVMSDCGAEAFAARDFAKVDRFRHHALSVIEFKHRVIQTRNTWTTPIQNLNTSSTPTPTLTTQQLTAV